MVNLVCRIFIDIRRFELPPISVRAGFVDTKHGLELTREDCRRLMWDSEQSRCVERNTRQYDALNGYAEDELGNEKKGPGLWG